MSEGAARVESIDAIKSFRIALLKFAENINSALGDAESEVQRTLMWLEHEQITYWQGQLRKRTEAVAKAKEAVRMKKLFKDSTGRPGSAVDEEKQLAIAIKRLEEAEQKIVAVKKYTRVLQKEIQSYKGSVQRLATSVLSDVPQAASAVGRMIEKLEEYVSLRPEASTSTITAESDASSASRAGETLPSMARGDVDEPPDADEPKPKAGEESPPTAGN